MRVFVTQRYGGCGVILVPRSQLQSLREDGYREATAAEVAGWYRTRGIAPPTCVTEQARTQPLHAPVVFVLSDSEPQPRAA